MATDNQDKRTPATPAPAEPATPAPAEPATTTETEPAAKKTPKNTPDAGVHDTNEPDVQGLPKSSRTAADRRIDDLFKDGATVTIDGVEYKNAAELRAALQEAHKKGKAFTVPGAGKDGNTYTFMPKGKSGAKGSLRRSGQKVEPTVAPTAETPTLEDGKKKDGEKKGFWAKVWEWLQAHWLELLGIIGTFGFMMIFLSYRNKKKKSIRRYRQELDRLNESKKLPSGNAMADTELNAANRNPDEITIKTNEMHETPGDGSVKGDLPGAIANGSIVVSGSNGMDNAGTSDQYSESQNYWASFGKDK